MARKSLLCAKENWRLGGGFRTEPCSDAVAPRADSQERKAGRCSEVPDFPRFLTILFLIDEVEVSFMVWAFRGENLNVEVLR